MTMSLNFAFLSFLLFLAACGTQKDVSLPKIVGGTPADSNSVTTLATVALQDDSGKVFCSGTLIHERLILTSAHCLVDKNPAEINIRMAKGEMIAVEAMRSYKAEQKFGLNFDVAWVRPNKAIKGYKPVEILQDPELAKSAEKVMAVGYGQLKSNCESDEPGCQTGKLMQTDLKVKENLNQGRWFHLLLTEAKKGSGPCLGDSGGPLFVTVNGESFLSGNFVGWDKRLVPELSNSICDNGQAIYNFAGGYRDWLESTSGVKLILNESLNPKTKVVENSLVVADSSNFQEWCQSRDETDAGWYTMQRLISLAGDYALEHGGDIRRVFVDCAYAEINLRNKIRLDKGLTIDSFAPDSFGANAPITDLRPLRSLETFDVEALFLDGHAIDDFTPIAALRALKRLQITDNTIVAESSLDVGSHFNLERLRVSNSAKAVQLETISNIPSLRYLTLENVRTEGSTVIIPGSKLLELSVKADIDLELAEDMSSLQTIELVGVRSIVMAKRLPKLRTFQMEDSEQAIRAGRSLVIEEMPQIESFNFSGNKGIAEINLPRLPKLKNLTIAASGVEGISISDDLLKLSKVDFSRNQLSSLPLLSGAPLLNSLNIGGNPIADLSVLNGLPLRVLHAENMNGGRLSSLGELNKLPKLMELRLKDNSFRSVKEFLRFPLLEVLVLSGNAIQDISNLSSLKELGYLEVVGNPLNTETCPLAEAKYCRFEWTLQDKR